MPPKARKANVNRHGTQEGQQTMIEHYKTLKNYKNIKVIDDDISRKIKALYEDNVWNFKEKIEDLKEHYMELGINGKISWEYGVQYLDYPRQPVPKNNISIKAFEEGEYKSLYTDKKPNDIKTEAAYAKRISFYTRTFKQFEIYNNVDDAQWIIKHNRELMYEIINYHNTNERAISTVNKDFKTLVRVIKLIMGETDELRYKFSALQVAFTDIENVKDDENLIKTKQELMQFIPYEQLLIICDELDTDYNTEFNKLPPSIQRDGSKHSDKLFHMHQKLIAVALHVWDYPSRHEKFCLDIIEEDSKAEPKKNYLVIQNGKVCKFIFNEVVKEHKPMSYNIDSKTIAGLNKRLNKLLKYSYSTYPRSSLFIDMNSWSNNKKTKVTDSTVSKWLREVIKDKNIGIDGLRSAFCTYYYNQFNNRQKTILKTRMRTSKENIERYYIKNIRNPQDLVRVKLEANEVLNANASVGVSRLTGLIVDDPEDSPEDNPQDNPVNRRLTNPPNIDNVMPEGHIDAHTTRNIKFKEWYQVEENKAKHKELVNKHSRKPSTYQKRLLRDLNSKRVFYDRLLQSTIKKYGILELDGVYYSELML